MARIYYISLMHSSIDGHVGCFHASATVNNTALKRDVQRCLWDSAFNTFGYIHRSETDGSCCHSFFNVLKNHHAVFYSGQIIWHFHQRCTRFQFLHILVIVISGWGFFFIVAFYSGCSSSYFWFAFPYWLLMLSTLSCIYWSFIYLLWRNISSSSLPSCASDFVVAVLMMNFKGSLYILNVSPL